MARAAVIGILLAAFAAGCGSGGGDVKGPLTVYVSLPLTGPRAADGNDAADGARLALEQADGRAGNLEVTATYLDDAENSRWSPVAVSANARRAVQDSSAAAYIGDLDSEPTRASVPITNQAGIVQISPGAGGVDLTQPAQGYPDSPDRYRPSGDSTFIRVVPNDAVQARTAAMWVAEAGFNRVEVISDKTPYGDLVAEEFTRAAVAAGVEAEADERPVGVGGKLAVFFSGESAPGAPNNVRLPRGTASVFGTDALLQNPDSGIDVGFFTTAALDPKLLPGKQFAPDFSERFGREPGPYAAYGFEAMTLALTAIGQADGKADGFRGRVSDAAFDADRDESVIGRYSITPDGDTTLCTIQRYEIEGAELRPIGPIPCLAAG
jgi:branched-chain amino acid transport system substrate-binding protein